MNIHIIRSPAHRWLRGRTAVLLALAFAAVAVGRDARAATITWDGSDSTAWATGANWVGGTAPASSLTTDIANFDLPTYGGNPVYAPAAPTTGGPRINGITIGGSNGAMILSTGAGVNRLEIGASGITVAAGAGALTIGQSSSAGMELGANQTWTNNSSSLVTIRSLGHNNAAAYTVTLAGSGTGGYTFNGAISEGATAGRTTAVEVDYTAGTVQLSATNTFSGGLRIKGGQVIVGQTDALGAGTVTMGYGGGSSAVSIMNNAATKSYSAPIFLESTHSGTVTIGATSGPATFTGGVTGTHDLIVDSSADVIFSTAGLNYTGNLTKNGASILSLAVANTLSGTALVNNGTLRVDHVDALQNATLDTGTVGIQAVTFSGTALTYTLGGLQGADALAITSTNTISVGNNNSSTTFSGTISGAGGQLTKIGAGTLSLSGNNSYTGATTVSAGELLINGNQSGAVGAVSVAANAILGGTGTLGGASAAITGTVAPGLSGSLGTLTFAGSAMNLSSGGSLLAQLNSNPAVFTSDLLAISGAGSLTLGGSSILDLVGPGSFTTSGTYTLATFASGSSISQFTTVRYNGSTYANPTNTNAVNSNGTLVYNADSIQFVVVPEPGTLALAGLGIGLGGFAAWKRRRVRHD